MLTGPATRALAALAVLLALAGACAPASTGPAAPGTPAQPPVGGPATPAAQSPAAAQPAAPPAPISITVGRAAGRATVAPLWLGQELGFFARHGLNVEETQMRSNAVIEAAMLQNEVQIGFIGLAGALASRAAGGETMLFASYLDRALGELMVRPDIRQPADLRGRILGVQSIGGTIHIRSVLALQKVGLDPERDNIQVLVVGDDPTLAQSLVAGVIDAATVGYTSSRRARAAGMHGWDMAELGVPESGTSVLATRTLARDKPEIVERFIKGLAEAVLYLKQAQSDAAKRERALQIAAAKLQIPPEEITVEMDRIVETANPTLMPNMTALAEFHAAVARHTPGVEGVPLNDVVDLRFLEKLEREGFFQQLETGS